MFFRKTILKNIIISGSTERQCWKKRNSFPSIFFGFRELISWKTYFEWFGKIINGVTQECFKKSIIQKKNCSRKSFPWNVFLNDTNISTGTEERRQKRKIFFRTSFSFSTENHFQKDQIFEWFGINTQRGTQEW